MSNQTNGDKPVVDASMDQSSGIDGDKMARVLLKILDARIEYLELRADRQEVLNVKTNKWIDEIFELLEHCEDQMNQLSELMNQFLSVESSSQVEMTTMELQKDVDDSPKPVQVYDHNQSFKASKVLDEPSMLMNQFSNSTRKMAGSMKTGNYGHKNVGFSKNVDRVPYVSGSSGLYHQAPFEKLQIVQGLPKTLETIFDVQKTLENVDDSSEKFVDAALEYLDKEQYEESIIQWKNAIELEKATKNRTHEMIKFFTNKSHCHFRLKQYKQVIEDATSALSYDSNRPTALNNRAYAHLHLGNLLSARDDFEKVLQLRPNYERAKGNLERVQEKIGKNVLK